MRAIDICLLPFTPETKAGAYAETPSLRESMERSGLWDTEFTADELVAEMDVNGIERSFLLAQHGGSWEVSHEYIRDFVADHPRRLFGLAGIDPRDIRAGVERMVKAIVEYGFVGALSYPHWFERSPADATYYPFYAKCVELDVPIEIQVGQAYQRDLPDVARPAEIDRVACDFPELRIVGIHTGYPWEREMIAVARKHPNVFIGADNWHPSVWPQELVEFIAGPGRSQVLWGTNKPAVDPAASLAGVLALGFDDETLDSLLYANSERVFSSARAPDR